MQKNQPQYAYIHGFNSDKNCRSYKDIKKILPGILDFHYSYMQNAELAIKEIENKLILAYENNPNLILFGSSLGGFFALYFAHKYELPCTVFNPVTYPHEQLAPFTGKNYNFYTHKEWIFTKEILLSYQNFPLNNKLKFCPNIILGMNDTTISPYVTLGFWKNHANILLTTEEHSIRNYEKYTLSMKKHWEKH